MTYNESLDIARILGKATTKAAKMLRAMTKQTGRTATFLIMRYGDPRKWRRIPQAQDRRNFRYRSKYTTKRPCRLTHIDGRTISASSIADFCDKVGLSTVDRLHVSPVLDGQRMSFKGWYLPETLMRKVSLRDIYGNVMTHTIRALIQEDKIKPSSIRRLLAGDTKSVRNHRVMLADTPIKAKIAPNSLRITKVKLKDGNRIYTGTSIPEVARKAGIGNLPALYSIAYGFRDDYHGTTFKEIEVERRRVF